MTSKYWKCSSCSYVFIIGKSTRTITEYAHKYIHCPRCNMITCYQVNKEEYKKGKIRFKEGSIL